MPTRQVIDVWTVSLDQDESLVDASVKILSPEEIARMRRFKPEYKRREFALSRALLRSVLGQALAAEPAALEFSYGGKGKPVLCGKLDVAELSFNLSHSGGMTVLAVTQGRAALGVDIERLRADVDCLGLARRYFSAREARELARLTVAARHASFFACWTRKEALVKALGMGVAFGLHEFSVSIDPADTEVRLNSEHPALSGDWRLYSFRPAPGYLAAVAIDDSTDRVIRQQEATPLLQRLTGGSLSKDSLVTPKAD